MKVIIFNLLIFLYLTPIFCQSNTEIGAITLNGRTVHNIVLGNVLAKISFEQAQRITTESYIVSQNLSQHYLDSSKYYRLWFRKLEARPLNNYDLYEFDGFPQFYLRNGTEDLVGGGYPFSYFSPLMKKGIIGLHKETNHLIFVSGYLFLDDLKGLMFPTIDKDAHDYVRLKYYNYSPVEIETISRRKSHQSICFYSEVMKKKFLVKIPFVGEDEIEEIDKAK